MATVGEVGAGEAGTGALMTRVRGAPVARPQAIATWLWIVAGLVVLMVSVGGITRLTESGLSITRWEPVSGILPPLTEAQWQAQFALYR